jgi:putative CocE/NonD family hydrolase
MAKLLKRIGLAFCALLGAAVVLTPVVILAAGAAYDMRPPPRTPGGLALDTAEYVRMGDGARIAVDVYLPRTLKAGQRVPVLIKATPYWRGYRFGFLAKAVLALGLVPTPADPDTAILNDRGYAVMVVDTRGTGASFGSQKIAFDDREMKDYDELIGWAAQQSWSNGRVGAYGFSYRGILATSMAAFGNPALKAIAPSFDFTDLYLVMYPGGVFNSRFVQAWSDQTATLNQGAAPCEGMFCHLLITGPKPVDTDRDGRLLAEAISEHAANYNVFACARAAPDRDDPICTSGKSLTDISVLARGSAIQASGVPMYVEVGYFDESSPAQALRRFQAFSNPQTLMIGPISHGGFLSTDPYHPNRSEPDPGYALQVARMADFFDTYLMQSGQGSHAKSVTYFVLGADAWRTSPTWPPVGVGQQAWYLQPGHGLSNTAPSGASGSDDYAVDFAASSGPLARYRSPVDLSRTTYPDRAAQDRRLATYTSAPVERPIEIVGDPVAHFTLASSRTDGAVIIYLEDVGPNGVVTYLSEGVLRLAHSRPAGPAASAISSDPLHSYLARDAGPIHPGQPLALDIALSPIAAVIHAGHRIRVAIAGADADNLERLPASGSEVFTIQRNARSASAIELPILATG